MKSNMKKNSKAATKNLLKIKRKRRVRKHIEGTPERPRLSVFRSARHVYCQIIDDSVGKTLVGASSFENNNKYQSATKENCYKIGQALATRCKEMNISKVVLDRNGQIYHGRIKAFAEGARNGGLLF